MSSGHPILSRSVATGCKFKKGLFLKGGGDWTMPLIHS